LSPAKIPLIQNSGDAMAISDSHFKAAVILPQSREPVELPMEMIAVVGGALVVLLLVLFLFKWRMNRKNAVLPGE